MVNSKLLEILVCPATKAPLVYKRELNELWCRASRLAYPIRDGMPVMVESEARELEESEYSTLS
ncbi:MAG: Trm112 family protein [Pseudomonadota bacterium]|nr:Trm112 family protein [Pseudomonadota bacterium]